MIVLAKGRRVDWIFVGGDEYLMEWKRLVIFYFTELLGD